ncbi:MAG: MFS transporter [Betaproteobacteria bacterium]|nr:MFS transporter [Betaproteobacteria bacterium]
MRAEAGGIALPLAVTLAVQTLVALAVYCAPVMAPVAGPALGFSPSAVGYYIAAVYCGSMIGSAAAGGWVARFGPIRASQAGLALCLAGLALAASAWPPLVMLGGFVVGLGYGPTTPASSVILVRSAPPGLFSLIFSIKQTGVPAGGVLAGALVPGLVLAFGWQWAAAAIGIACLALALAIAPVRSRYDRELDPLAPVSFRSALAPLSLVLRAPQLRQMCVTSFVYGGVQITLVTYLVTFLVASFQLTLVLAGLVMAVSQVASVLGRVLWGVLADRALSRRAMLGLLGLGMGVSALAALAAGPAWPLWLLFVYASLFGATAVGWNGVFLAEVARVAPAGRTSEATGGCLFFTFLGVVVTPPAFNAVLALGGDYAVAYAVFAVPALAVGGWMLARIRQP